MGTVLVQPNCTVLDKRNGSMLGEGESNVLADVGRLLAVGVLPLPLVHEPSGEALAASQPSLGGL